MRTASLIINAFIFVATLTIIVLHFRKNGAWQIGHGLKQFRYFTVLSNALCAIGALAVAISQACGSLSHPVFVLKYIGTVSVTVTILTVFLFLGPSQGYGNVLSGDFFYMHLVGPLSAILSFCLLERRRMTLGTAMLGALPVLLYGAVYIYKVLLAPEGRHWEDHYGFNRGGLWPVAAAVMLAGTCAVCLLFWKVSQL